jgi:hypothetical protein
MDNFRELFDPHKLNEQQLGQIEFVLMSPAYEDSFEPYLRSIRDTLAQRLLDPSKARVEEHPDNFLRGGIVAIDGLLNFFAQVIKETQFDRVTTAMNPLTPAQRYTQAQQDGKHDSILGAAEPLEPEPYDPAEDY